jgi:hypothetical protein
MIARVETTCHHPAPVLSGIARQVPMVHHHFGKFLILCLFSSALGQLALAQQPDSTPSEGSATATVDEGSAAQAAWTGVCGSAADGTFPAGVTIPDSALGTHLCRVLDLVNLGVSGTTGPELEALVTPEFAAQVPGAMLRLVLAQLHTQLAPLTLRTLDVAPDGLSARGILDSGESGPFSVSMVIEPTGENRMAGLLFAPAPEADLQAPDTWDEFLPMLADVAPDHTLFVAEVVDGACVPVQAVRQDEAFPLGSTFKLYVLHALASQIVAGQHSWTETLPIQDDLRSLPSGTMQNDPVGTVWELAHYARQMISISDNTATDHLMHLVGEEAIQQALIATENSAIERMQPFLSTRDMFILKGAPESQLQSWLEAPDAAARRTLYETIQSTTTEGIRPWTAPRAVDSVEWFASGEDLCDLMVSLHDLVDDGAGQTLRDVLSVNPGIPQPPGRWNYFGYKGGSEPGVLNLTWYAERADGRVFFISIGFMNTGVALNDNLGASLAGYALNLAAATP